MGVKSIICCSPQEYAQKKWTTVGRKSWGLSQITDYHKHKEGHCIIEELKTLNSQVKNIVT